MRIDSSTEFAIRAMVNSICPHCLSSQKLDVQVLMVKRICINVYAISISYATHVLEKYIDANIFIQKLVKPPGTPFRHLRDPTAAKVWDFAWWGYRHPATRPSWDHVGHDWYPPIGIGNKLSHPKLRRSINLYQQFADITNHSKSEHPCTTNKNLSVLQVLCIFNKKLI